MSWEDAPQGAPRRAGHWLPRWLTALTIAVAITVGLMWSFWPGLAIALLVGVVDGIPWRMRAH